MMIAIIDYGVGNLQSVINAFEKVGTKAFLVSDPDKLISYDKAILPGVGAFGDAMEHLHVKGMDGAVREFAASGKPLMGICLGMQLLFEKSQEFGESKGLGLIPGEVVPFDQSRFKEPLKIPHMGWNTLKIKKQNALLKDLPEAVYLYFVHSFHALTKPEFTIGTTFYGYEFTSAVQKENIYGFQPHPEKSHEYGLRIYKNFTEL
jgi:glutamine amidotransferase